MSKKYPSPIASFLLTVLVASVALGAHFMQAGIGSHHLGSGVPSWPLFFGYWLSPYFLAAIVAILAGAAVDIKRANRVRATILLAISWTYLAIHFVTIINLLYGPMPPLATRLVIVFAAGLISQAAWWIVRSWRPQPYVKALSLTLPTIVIAIAMPLISFYVLRITQA